MCNSRVSMYVLSLITAYFPLLAATPAAQQQRIIPISSSAIIGGFGIESIQLSRQLQKKFSGKP